MDLPSFIHSTPILKKAHTDAVRGVPTLRAQARQSGFTLIELLVVIGIIVVTSGIVFANNSRFGGVVQLQNLAYDIALTIRQAQVYGISVSRFNNTSTYAAAYGMHFSKDSPDSFQLFGDVTTINGVFDPLGTPSELVANTRIQTGYAIHALYVTPQGSADEIAVDSMDITYRRPNPDAFISKNGDPFGFDLRGKYVSGLRNSQARIVVRSPRGDLKEILIYTNGQISVQ